MTHTPPRDILDRSSSGRSYGCAALASELPRIAPRVHCFGHVHAGAGRRQVGETLCINAASIESGTGRMRSPMTFTLSSGGSEGEDSPSSRGGAVQRWLRKIAAPILG